MLCQRSLITFLFYQSYMISSLQGISFSNPGVFDNAVQNDFGLQRKTPYRTTAPASCGELVQVFHLSLARCHA